MARSPTELKNRAMSELITLLTSNAIVVTRKWYKKDERRSGVYGLNETLLPRGKWLIFAQASFSAELADKYQIEIQARLSAADGEVNLLQRDSYLRLIGGAFGTATAIGAIAVTGTASLEFSYQFQLLGFEATGGASVRDSIIIAVKTPDLLILS